MKRLIYLKWAILAVLAIIVVLWLSYFFDSLNKSQHQFFLASNYALDFLKWVNHVSNGVLLLRSRLFDDIFYLEDFPGIILFAEVLFIVLLVFAATLQKQKRKQYVLKLCISIFSFVFLFEFLDATLKLFVPG